MTPGILLFDSSVMKSVQDGIILLNTHAHAIRKQLQVPCHENPRMPSTCRTSLVKRRESRTGKRSSNASSCGSCVQPSIGIPFAARSGCEHSTSNDEAGNYLRLCYSILANYQLSKHVRGRLQLLRDPLYMIHSATVYMTVTTKRLVDPTIRET